MRVLTVLGRFEVLRLGEESQDLQPPDLLCLLSSPAEDISAAADVRHLLPGGERDVKVHHVKKDIASALPSSAAQLNVLLIKPTDGFP